MAKKSSVKKEPAKKSSSQLKNKPVSVWTRARQRWRDFLSRRPHRSFRPTSRRDYVRGLKLPGYWQFTLDVFRLMRQNKKNLLLLGVAYFISSALLLGIASQDSFVQVREAISQAGEELFQGDWGALGQAATLTLSTISGSISPTLTDIQQVYTVLLGLVIWMSVVWLLRQQLAGNTVKVRDALYSSGSPLVATALVFLIMILQLLPVMIAIIGYSAATTSGLLEGGVEAMLFWLAAIGLASLSLYWITSTAFALVVVTLPGMYPLRAMRIAGDMVLGRRLRILYRLLWMALIVMVLWVVSLILVIMADTWLSRAWSMFEIVPLVPVFVLLLSVTTFIGTASYVYLLYRRVVDDDSKPA